MISVKKQMSLDDFDQLARNLKRSSEELVQAIAYVLEIQGSDVTEENIVAIWQDPTIEQFDLIKERAILLALENGLETDDELWWGGKGIFATL